MARSRNSNRNRRARERAKTGLPSAPPAQHLRNAEEILDAVRHAAEDFMNAPTESRAKTAIRNFLEQGRSLTWALAHLEGAMAPGEWDQWWDTNMADLKSDPAARWFYELRNPIVKEGRPVDLRAGGVSVSGYIGPVDARPTGASGWAIKPNGDAVWIIAGGIEIPAAPHPGVRRLYTLADIPADLQAQYAFPVLMRRYVQKLEALLNIAHARFGAS